MIIDKLNDLLNSYNTTSTLTSLCIYIKENIHDIPNMTIDDIATSCHISKGQVSKCIRKLDYQNYEEFIHECLGYLDSLNRRQLTIDKDKTLNDNLKIYTNELISNIEYTTNNIDTYTLKLLINDILASKHIYLYGSGDVRSILYNIQRELNIYQISVTLCDVDFYKSYSFQEDDLLLVFSTNGNTFHFDKRVIKRIKDSIIKKWLITCNDSIILESQKLIIPTKDYRYNEYMVRHIIDIVLLHVQNKFH